LGRGEKPEAIRLFRWRHPSPPPSRPPVRRRRRRRRGGDCGRNIWASNAARLIEKARRSIRDYGRHFCRAGRNNEEKTPAAFSCRERAPPRVHALYPRECPIWPETARLARSVRQVGSNLRILAYTALPRGCDDINTGSSNINLRRRRGDDICVGVWFRARAHPALTGARVTGSALFRDKLPRQRSHPASQELDVTSVTFRANLGNNGRMRTRRGGWPHFCARMPEAR